MWMVEKEARKQSKTIQAVYLINLFIFEAGGGEPTTSLAVMCSFPSSCRRLKQRARIYPTMESQLHRLKQVKHRLKY